MNHILLILSVLVGALLVLFIKPQKKFVTLLLAFSGAYLLSVTVLHLLPELYSSVAHEGHHHEVVSSKYVGVLILIGILVQSVLESLSKGLEHGHIHLHEEDVNKFPWTLFISLCIHAFSEGLPIHNTNENLLFAIVVHKIPIAIVLTTLLIHCNLSNLRVFLALIIFSFMTPLGYLLASETTFLAEHHVEITALIVGIFFHISTIILFESSENHKFNVTKFGSILVGIILAIITL